MADELNVPTHRWYEPRNNIALPPNAVSAKYILANGVALIDAWINSRPWGPYSVDGFVPPLALDFVADYYQTDSTATTFDSALTFTRASSATMVDSTGAIVTVASGVPRRGHHVYNGSEWVNEGLLVESEARTNLFLNSGTLSTQSVTVTAVPHTLSFTGTGTVTLTGVSTAGPLVGTGTGENNRVSLTFTPTAGVLLATVTGTVTNAQLEAGSTPSSYIPTAGATVTRAAETLVIPSSNLPWSSTAVSIAMDGRATGNTLTTARWYSSSTAYITQSIGTTNFSFAQYGGGALDTVTGGSITPDINVPFNIASRHGSTFINGAVDGVALTADLTPVALPNLSATNLQLGYTFMGTIGSFRIWADDIGDAGLVTATAPDLALKTLGGEFFLTSDGEFFIVGAA